MNYQPPALFYQAIDEFNRRLFFECHETLEQLWNEEPGDLRYFYQGMLKVGVGYYKIITKPNYRGALSLLQSGADLLEPFAPSHFGLDVAHLVLTSRHTCNELIGLGEARYTEFDRRLVPYIMIDGKVFFLDNESTS